MTLKIRVQSLSLIHDIARQGESIRVIKLFHLR